MRMRLHLADLAQRLDLQMIDGPEPMPARLVWSVAALVQAVADALAARFSPCTVQGEISGWSRAASGHCYFTLKDGNGGTALLRCAMFRRAASLLDFTPADGQLVELRGRVGVYEARGELQIIVESLRRAGAGALYEQFLKLRAKLEAEGLFDASRKRTLPAFPRSIGLITSSTGAALHDVLSSLARRAPHVQVVLYPSPVQGTEAPAALCAALALANQRDEVDTLILCRGGGSLEDLWAFNDERVVRAVASSALPLVCGVGHETDVSLADLAADLRAPTPTAAAELAVPERATCLRAIDLQAQRLVRSMHDRIDRQAQGLDHLAQRMARPADLIRRRAASLDLLAHRLRTAVRRRLEHSARDVDAANDRLRRAAPAVLTARNTQLQALDQRLRALDPQRVLARGYAWLADQTGRPVRSVRLVRDGSAMQARLADGAVNLVVTGVLPDEPG